MATLCDGFIWSFLASETVGIRVLFPSSWRCPADNDPPYNTHGGRRDWELEKPFL